MTSTRVSLAALAVGCILAALSAWAAFLLGRDWGLIEGMQMAEERDDPWTLPTGDDLPESLRV